MSKDGLYYRSVGQGRPLVLVHGSAANADGWGQQTRALKDGLHILCVERLGLPRSALPQGTTECSVATQAEALAELVEQHIQEPTVFCGSSFGAVCVLHLARTRPELVSGMILCEPPLPPQDDLPPVVAAFIDDFEARYHSEGGASAARFFLSTVLGQRDFEAMPKTWRERAESMAEAIRMDVHALRDYQPDFESLRGLEVPALMLGGARSEAYFVYTLERLRMVLPNSARLTLQDAGHMMHLDQPEAFNRAVRAFVDHFIAERGAPSVH